MAGRLDEAIACYRRGVALAGDAPVPLSFLGHALAASGQTDEARQILERLLGSALPLDLELARVYVGLGDAGAALQWLDVAIERRNIHLVTVSTDVRFDPLRGHPRFLDLLRRMNLS